MQMFKAAPADTVRVEEARLRRTTQAIFEKMGVSPADAAVATDCLVISDLRGVESHGVSNMLRVYVRLYREGLINPKANWKVVRETPATANIDSDRGLGIIVAPRAMEIAIEKAANVGVGMATMFNGGHAGMISYHAMQALPHDMIGMCTTAAGALMLPTFGREPRLGTNPIAFAAPAGKEAPFVFDAATTVLAGNQLTAAKRLGKLLPPGVIANPDGTPLMDDAPPPDEYRHMLPLGSTRESGSHKGYGLAAIVEILGSILAGAPSIMRQGRNVAQHWVCAIRIDAFCDVDEYKQNMDDFLYDLRTTPTMPGADAVVYAGQNEAAAYADRRANGIPLHKEVIGWFGEICGELEIEGLG